MVFSRQAFHKYKIPCAAENKADAAQISPIGFGEVAHNTLEDHVLIFLGEMNGLDSLAQKKRIRPFYHNTDAFTADVVDEESRFTNGDDGAVLCRGSGALSAVFHFRSLETGLSL
jgi:hypothetical protein